MAETTTLTTKTINSPLKNDVIKLKSDVTFNTTTTGALLQQPGPSKMINLLSVIQCREPEKCVTLKDILEAFNAAISEEQAWALIYQTVKLFRDVIGTESEKRILKVPMHTENLSIHRNGSVHINTNNSGMFIFRFSCCVVLKPIQSQFLQLC